MVQFPVCWFQKKDALNLHGSCALPHRPWPESLVVKRSMDLAYSSFHLCAAGRTVCERQSFQGTARWCEPLAWHHILRLWLWSGFALVSLQTWPHHWQILHGVPWQTPLLFVLFFQVCILLVSFYFRLLRVSLGILLQSMFNLVDSYTVA